MGFASSSRELSVSSVGDNESSVFFVILIPVQTVTSVKQCHFAVSSFSCVLQMPSSCLILSFPRKCLFSVTVFLMTLDCFLNGSLERQSSSNETRQTQSLVSWFDQTEIRLPMIALMTISPFWSLFSERRWYSDRFGSVVRISCSLFNTTYGLLLVVYSALLLKTSRSWSRVTIPGN